MKTVLLSLLGCFILNTLWAQVDDPILMTIAGKQVTRAEFEYAFNKNVEKGKELKSTAAIKEYADLFVNYKLKVKAAEDASLDTIGAFVKEFKLYRDVQLRPFLKDSCYIDSISHMAYEILKEQTGDSDMIQMAHIFLSVPQRNGETIRADKKQRIDSIYSALQSGADFMELAIKYSEDPNSSKGNVSPWIVPKQMLQEFEDIAYSLKIGGISKPFQSVAGYHIIKVTGRKKLEPYEEKRNEILNLLQERGINDMSAEYRIEKIMSQEGKTREEVLSEIQKKAIVDNPKLQFLINEYHDGLLMYEACRMFVWDKAANDEYGLSDYFKNNKKKFQWEKPHFKGYVLFAKTETLADNVEKILKKCKEDEGLLKINKEIDKEYLSSVKVRYGVFASGDDPFVDASVFGKPMPPKDKVLPVSRVVGKMIKQPKSYKDVKSRIIPDYQDVKEKEWIEGLRKKYTIEINQNILKTVNNH